MMSGSAWRTSLLVAGLVVTGTLAVALVQVRAERAELTGKIEGIGREIADLEQQAGRLRIESATLAETETIQRARAAVMLSPLERGRRSVGPLVARFKAAHAAHPPPVLPPPPPMPRDDSMGQVFPELLDNAEYTRGLFLGRRLSIAREYRKALEAVGCDARMVEDTIDLLTHREMVRYDARSLTAESAPFTENAAALKARAELDQQLRRLLGAERYARLEEPAGDFTITAKADGTAELTTRPAIPVTPAATRVRQELQALETRLSYSEAPLDASQQQALAEALGRLPEEKRFLSPVRWVEPEMAAIFKAVLKPKQWLAVEALRDESAAFYQRARLPRQ